MLKHHQEQVSFLVRVTDVIVCVAAFFIAYLLRTSPLFQPGSIGSVGSVSWMLTYSVAIHFLLYPPLGFYESLRLKSPAHIVAMVLRAFVAEFFILGSLVFLFQEKTTSRYFFGLFLVLNYSLVLAEKLGARILLSSIRKRGYNYRQVLIAGTGANAKRVVSILKRNKHWGYIPCGVLRESGADSTLTEVDGVPILGQLSDLEKIIHSRAVDEIYFAQDVLNATEVTQESELCERLGIPIRFSLGFLDLPNSKITFMALDRLPVVTFYTTLMTPAEAMIKRVMDFVIAVIGLIMTAILYPWISWKIKRESPGPVIFKQIRVGENGRRFRCYKFRTMYADADQKKADLENENQMEGPIFKIENDPRITRFGAFLRRTSLDELPQFFNILRGDMSVVGTRPPTPDEVNRYQTHYRRRLSIRPGLTGLWQVSGRNQVTRFEDILALDLQYIDHWSIWLDIQIIFRTLWITLFRRGAY